VAEVVAPDGTKSFPFGETPKGVLIFTADGQFTQIHIAGDVPKIASNNRLTSTPEEYGPTGRETAMKNGGTLGVWREIVRADGSVTPDVLRASQIMYSPDGYMCVVNTPIARKKAAETVARMDLDATSKEERAEAALGVVAYAGRFEVTGEECATRSSPRSIPTGSATPRCGASRSRATA
jgi:hypothetical protein